MNKPVTRFETAPVRTPGTSFELCTRDGEQLHVEDWGRGRPVVLVHGWSMSAAFWEYQAEALVEAGLRCIAYDQRGCGRSSRAAGGYELDGLADDLDEVLRACEAEDAVVVGHSMAAATVVRALSRHGGRRVAKAVLVCGTTPTLGAAGALEPQLQALRADRPRYLKDLAGPFFAPAEVSPELVGWGVGLCLQASLRAALEYTRTNLTTDVTGELAAIGVPTLVVHGDADVSTPLAATGVRTAGLIPGAGLKVYEGAGHGLPLTHAARLNADLIAFAGG